MASPLTIKLRCASWKQLAQIYKRDLTRSAVFLKTQKPPPLGTQVRVNLTLPSETLIILTGAISEHVPVGGLNGRGPGIDIKLKAIPQSAMWLIESALASASKTETSSVRRMPAAAAEQAVKQRSAPRRLATSPNRPPRTPDVTPVPALEESARLVDAEGQLLVALETEFATLRGLNPFQLLNVGYSTDDQQVRDAFARLTKKYHPDRFARFQSREARELASEIFILIRDAYRRIGSPRAREQTLAKLGRTPAPRKTPVPATASRTPPPRAPRSVSSRRATTSSGTSRPSSGARPLPPPPSKLNDARLFDHAPAPDAPERPLEFATAPRRVSGFGHAEDLVEQGAYVEALKIYSLAAKRNPGDLRARAGLEMCEGLKALAERDRLEAAQRFEMVLELDPENERAVRELAEMRRQATQDRKGLLARLLGKKE